MMQGQVQQSMQVRLAQGQNGKEEGLDGMELTRRTERKYFILS